MKRLALLPAPSGGRRSRASFALVILLRLLIYMAFFRAGAIPPMTPIGN